MRLLPVGRVEGEPAVDKYDLRRVAPVVYGLLVVLCALFADDALVPVAVVGALLLGLLYALVRPAHGRDRQRQRRRA